MSLILKSTKVSISADEFALNQFCPVLRHSGFSSKLDGYRERLDYDGVVKLKVSGMLKVLQLKFLRAYLKKPDTSYVRLMHRWDRYVKYLAPKISDIETRRQFLKDSGTSYSASLLCVQELNEIISDHQQYSFNVDTSVLTHGMVKQEVTSHIDIILNTDKDLKMVWFTKSNSHFDPRDPAGYINSNIAFATRWIIDKGIHPSFLYFISFTTKGTHFIRKVPYTNSIHGMVMELTSTPVNTAVDLSKCIMCPVRNYCPMALKRKYGIKNN